MAVHHITREQFDAQFGCWDGSPLLIGWTQRRDTEVVVQLLRWKKPRVIFEIGTCLGDMTANLCHYSRPDAQVLTLDICEEMGIAIPENQRVSGELRKRAEIGRRTNYFGDGYKARQIFCDSMLFDWTTIARPDFVFIDGNHQYEHVRHDSEQALQHLNDDGVIVWHDYGNEVCTRRAIDEVSDALGGVRHVAGTWVAFYTERFGKEGGRRTNTG